MHATKRVIRAAIVCATTAMLAVSTSAAAGNCYVQHRLGGTFVGAWIGPASDQTETRIEFTMTQAPLDLFGRTAAINFEWLTVGKDFEALWELLDIRASGVVGQMATIDRDTAKYTVVWYGISNELPKEIRAIYVLSGEMDFDGPNKLVDHSTIKIYLTNSGVGIVDAFLKSMNPAGPGWPYPDADADHDLLPDAGAVPFVMRALTGAAAKRVPLLAP